MSVCASADGEDIKVVVNGTVLKLDQPPVVIGGRTMVPLRAIFEAIGAEVNWNPETNTITGEKGLIVSKFTLDGSKYYVNDIPLETDVAPTVLNDRTFVPARVIAESFGCEVSWEGDTNTVTIVSKELQEYAHDDPKYTYYGDMKDGKPCGYGFQDYYEAGTKYIGTFKDGLHDGKGTQYWDDMIYYTGEWKNGLRNGWGVQTTPAGNKYDGQWLNDKMHGIGTYYWANGNVYSGEFANGAVNGKGVVTYSDGSKYVGEFKENKKHGQGVYYYADGTVDRGLWENGEFVE